MTVAATITNQQATSIVRPIARQVYAVDYSWSALNFGLETYRKDYGLNLTPDFQRGHVWTPEQQAHYIENVLRGVIPPETMVIQFNCPHWDDHEYSGELPREMQVVDGLQRLTAALAYLDGRVTPFGMSIKDFAGTDFDVNQRHKYRFRFAVHAFQTKRQLLQHYLDLNTGGTPHSEQEVGRVQRMLEAA